MTEELLLAGIRGETKKHAKKIVSFSSAATNKCVLEVSLWVQDLLKTNPDWDRVRFGLRPVPACYFAPTEICKATQFPATGRQQFISIALEDFKLSFLSSELPILSFSVPSPAKLVAATSAQISILD